jgi:hypothetical protein
MNGLTSLGPIRAGNVVSTAVGAGGRITNNFVSPSAFRKPPFYVPFPENPDYVQRPYLAARLDSLISPIGSGQRVALYGLGGSG